MEMDIQECFKRWFWTCNLRYRMIFHHIGPINKVPWLSLGTHVRSTSLGNAGKIHLKGFSLDSPWQHAKRGSWDISKFKDQQAFCIFLVCCWLEVSVLGGTFLHILFAGSVKLHWKLKFHEKFLQFFYVFIGFLLVLLTFSFIPALNGTKSLSVVSPAP